MSQSRQRNRNYRRRKKSYIPRGYVYIAAIAILFTVVLVGIVGYKKYSFTNEHVELTEFFTNTHDSEVAVVLNGDYKKSVDESGVDLPYANAIKEDGTVYLELNFIKGNIDDGYVYDSTEITLRYATDTEIYTATLGSADYSIDKSYNSLSAPALVAKGDYVYVSLEYLHLLSDFQSTIFEDPDRIIIETAGYEKQVATAKKDTAIRILNGKKSAILEDVEKGEELNVIRATEDEDWSFVVSEKGVMGYIQNKRFSEPEATTVEATLPERTYNHINAGSDISLLWHQMLSQDGNANIATVLADSGNIDVISPTWFRLSDNQGNISSVASSNYVSVCHAANVQVWGLVTNVDSAEVDADTVLNTTSSRDKLVNNIIAQAITYGLDGVNIDFEALGGGDGFIEFIKELSIKCEKNDIILSVDNHAPAEYNAFYNLEEQAKYADYVVVMAYDEHAGNSEEAGSVASISWVEEAVKNTLNSVPAEQVIMAMPFYCRVWKTSAEGTVLDSEAYGFDGIQKFLNNHEVTAEWNEEYGQNYVEFVEGDITYKVWVEDETSLEEKLKVMDNYGLAGGAFWKKGFDNSAAWNVIAKYL
ncbi:glycosyl hydrolase family 18 protein [Pseudobutyrivibrio sp.]|uniref:glycosyl hydrolase family 18 protein n=1 Tax=Pseudobutyrivibrio sp. TaxID=2014367 RepID=UPI0025FFCE15|nr:glycosyl hydrolase family 18 protein [Pseudobutyrivibrio sp.]